MPESHILTETFHGVGVITFNREEKQNALTLEMIRIIDKTLRAWASDNSIHMVMVRNKGQDFCTGADLEAFNAAFDDRDMASTRDYYREEYILNRLIYHYPKPYLSLLNGWVRSDGVGLSLFGSTRVANENTRLVLSETDIGFIVDGGATYFLSRFPGYAGWYAGLSGTHIQAADALYLGAATHYISARRTEELQNAIFAANFTPGKVAEQLEALLKGMHVDPGASEIQQQQKDIDHCFGQSSIEAIMYALAEGESDWHQKTLKRLMAASPTSLKITHKLIKAGRRLTFDEALQLEFRVSQYVMRQADFREGIRAHIIEGDHKPRWSPDIPEAVSTALIDSFFEPLPEGELKLDIS